MTTSYYYDDVRAAYWEAQSNFRDAAVAEIKGLLSDGHSAVLEINDTPRLSPHAIVDADGIEVLEGEIPEVDDTRETIDSIAADMEVFDWSEATNFLPRTDDGDLFIITND